MTLAEVAKRLATLYPKAHDVAAAQRQDFSAYTHGLFQGVNSTLEEMKADPDYTLRDRVENLAILYDRTEADYLRDMKHPMDKNYIEATHEFARRLRELLK